MRLGFVPVWRKMLDSAVMQDDWLCRLWVWCMLKANHQNNEYRGIQIPAGAFVTTRAAGSEQLRVSAGKFYRGLNTLKTMGNLYLKNERDFTVVTLCHWQTYKLDSDAGRAPSERQVSAGRAPSERQVSAPIRENDKNGIREEVSLFAAAAASADEPTLFNALTPHSESPSPAPALHPVDAGNARLLATDMPTRTKKRDELWEALIALSGADPVVNGSHLGRVVKALRSADPPYTAADVLRLPEAAAAANLSSFSLTLAAIEKHIYLTRRLPAKTQDGFANGKAAKGPAPPLAGDERAALDAKLAALTAQGEAQRQAAAAKRKEGRR